MPSLSDPAVEMWEKPLCEFNTKYSEGIDFPCVHANLCIVLMNSSVIDCCSVHANLCIVIMKSSVGTTRFSQTFIKTSIILQVNNHFGGNFGSKKSTLTQKKIIICKEHIFQSALKYQ